jgi:DNA-directed RNA polymerase specialized sigma24 family protein
MSTAAQSFGERILVGRLGKEALGVAGYGALASEPPTKARVAQVAFKSLAGGANPLVAFHRGEAFSHREAPRRTSLLLMHPDAERSKPSATAGNSKSPVFGTTHWTTVLAAGDRNHPDTNEAIDRLCRTYWYPVYAYVRRKGRIAADAEDLTQEFFSRLLARDFPAGVERQGGKFRSYLLRSLDHFLINEWTRGKAVKRGGGATTFSLDGVDADARYALEPADGSTPESVYDRRWAATVLETVRARLRDEYATQGKGELFAALEPSLTGGGDLRPHSELMAELDLKPSALKMAVHRLRKRFGELLRDEIAQTVSTPAEVEDELRQLITAASS